MVDEIEGITKMRRIKPIKQLTQSECGICCCLMLLNYYKSKETMKDLQEELDVGRDGTSIFQLQNVLQSKELASQVFKTESLKSLSKINLPCILFWDQKHFVVLEKIKDDRYHIVDPEIGRKTYTEYEMKKFFSNVVLVSQPTENYQPRRSKKHHPWSYLAKQLLEYKVLFIYILILLAMTYLLTLLMPRLIQELLDNIDTIDFATAGLIVLAMMAFYIFIFILRNHKILILKVYLSKKIEANTFKHLLHLPYKFFNVRSTGDLLYRLSSTSAIKELIATQIIAGIVDLGSILVVFVYMVMTSLPLTILSLILFLLNMLSLFIFQPQLRQAIDNEILEQSKAQTIQVETLYSIDTVKLSNMEDVSYSRWYNSFLNALEQFRKRMLISNLNHCLTSTIQMFSPLLIFIFGLQEMLNHHLTLGELIAFQTISTQFFSTGGSLFNAFTQFVLANQYLERVSDIWFTKAHVQSTSVMERSLTGAIEMKDISFSYNKNSPPVLKNTSLKIRAGEKIAFVGASGSGKSTLSKIIVGLYEPSKGEIEYDGIPIDRISKKSLATQISIVPQNAMLFNKTIAENIVMSNTVRMEELIEVAKMACIHDEIDAMPMGYQTLVSEFGMNLSGGQRQRILLARALLNKPKIIVLDEATSSLDALNEKKISEYLANLGCTTLVIAHRLSTIKNSDCIYVFDKGKIAESGTHEALLDSGKIYKRLYESL